MVETKIAVPTEQQIAWQNLELGMFVHYGINTFCNQEWGEGTDSPSLFNPAELDARQWVKLAKKAGFKYFILTAKHHDGFCLWPTETTDYSVKNSPWKNGQGDIVRECAEACQEEGILFGIYLSPWDRHEPCYQDKQAYDDFYCSQLTELLTGYGSIVEVWFDGAGSEEREYDWARIIGVVKKNQPDAMRFNMGQPTIRWVGNEDGVAPYPCWNSKGKARTSMFTNEEVNWLPGTPEWLPAECDVPIRKNHWFWHPNDEDSLLSIDGLLDIYYHSVGHGTNLLLNIAPDNRGLIPKLDEDRVLEFGNEIKNRFSNPLAVCTGEGTELILELPSELDIDHVILKEDIQFGERIGKYEIQAWQSGTWHNVANGSAIGHKKIDELGSIRTNALKLVVSESIKTPKILEFSCFNTGK
ncbi:alpha-L-fucosidase [Peribacillus sp. JNUCC 23]